MTDPCCAFPEIQMVNNHCWHCRTCGAEGCRNAPQSPSEDLDIDYQNISGTGIRPIVPLKEDGTFIPSKKLKKLAENPSSFEEPKRW